MQPSLSTINDVIIFSSFEGELTRINLITDPTDGQIDESFDKKIIEIRRSAFECFNEFIYSGEYCLDNVIPQIKLLSNFIEEQNDLSMAFGAGMQDYAAEHIRYVTEELYKPITVALGLLSQLTQQIQDRFSLHPRKLVIRQSIKDNINSFDLEDKRNIELLLFRINVFVANCDHFLSNNDSFERERLENIIDFFQEESFPHIKRLLLKSRYIRAKMLLRDAVKIKHKNGDTRDLYVRNKGVLKQFDPKSGSDLYPYFSRWIDHLIDHYQLSTDWKNNLRYRVDNLRLSTENSATTTHLRIKSYKDSEANLDGLKKLEEEFENVYPSSAKNLFDIYARKISFSYYRNNYFSLLCELKKTDYNDIENEYTKIREEVTGIKNYFPETKYLDSLLNNFDHLFAKGQDGYENIVDCDKIINQASIIAERYEENIIWVKNNYNYIFQLPFKECFIDIDSQKLFVFSSFLLPIDRDQLEKEFNENKQRLNIYKSSLSIYKSTSVLYHSYKDLKDENERKDSKNMEILGLFVAIVTFTAGVIPGFKFINTGTEAIFFTLALGLSMSSFAVTLYVLGRQRNRKESLKKILGTVLLTIGAFFGFSILIWSIAYRNMKDSFKVDKYIDNKVEEAIKKIEK